MRFAIIILLITLSSAAASAHVRKVRTLQWRRIGAVKATDMIVGSQKGFNPVSVTRLTVGSLLSHPIKPIEIVKYSATRSRVQLTWRENGKLKRFTFLPHDELRAIPHDELIRSSIDKIENFGPTIRMTFRDRANQQATPTTINERRDAMVLIDRTDIQWIKPKAPPPAAEGQ